MLSLLNRPDVGFWHPTFGGWLADGAAERERERERENAGLSCFLPDPDFPAVCSAPMLLLGVAC